MSILCLVDRRSTQRLTSTRLVLEIYIPLLRYLALRQLAGVQVGACGHSAVGTLSEWRHSCTGLYGQNASSEFP